MFKKSNPDLANMALHLMQQEAQLRLQADVLAALMGHAASSAGSGHAALLDRVHAAGPDASDVEERLGHATDRANAAAMRDELTLIMVKAKAQSNSA